MAFFQPSDISGLFCWYKSTGDSNNNLLSLPDGSAVTYWSDNSGSGNHLLPSVSSTSHFPTYYSNQQNGYPAIRFNGAGNYLQVTNNDSLNLSPSSLTLFILYKTIDHANKQVIAAMDTTFSPFPRKGQWETGLNYTYPSSWYWGWQNEPTGPGGG